MPPRELLPAATNAGALDTEPTHAPNATDNTTAPPATAPLPDNVTTPANQGPEELPVLPNHQPFFTYNIS